MQVSRVSSFSIYADANIFKQWTIFLMVQIVCFKVRTQCFSGKLKKIIIFDILIHFRKYLVVSKFLLQVTKIKESVLICGILVIKEHDLLPILLQEATILAA